jgi:hypothetical protein
VDDAALLDRLEREDADDRADRIDRGALPPQDRREPRAGLRVLQEGADHRRPRHDHDRAEHQRRLGGESQQERRQGGRATPRDRDPQGQQPSHDPPAVAFELLEDQVESAVEQDDRDRQLDEGREGLAQELRRVEHAREGARREPDREQQHDRGQPEPIRHHLASDRQRDRESEPKEDL